MNIFLRIILGLGIAAIGFVFVWKTRKFIEFFGSIPWADAKLGGGGTALTYKFIGIVLIFVGFMVATDLWGAFLEATLGSIFPKPEIPTTS